MEAVVRGVEFTEEGHEYRIDGVVRASNTTILAAVFGNHFHPGPKKVIGKNVHQALQWMDEGDTPEIGENIKPYVDSYYGLIDTLDLHWFDIEKIVVDYGQDLPVPVPGRMDRNGLLWGQPFVMDIKCGAVCDTWGPQLAGYVRAAYGPGEWTGVQRCAAKLRSNGKPGSLIHFKDTLDFDAYRGAVWQFYEPGDPFGPELIRRWRNWRV